ncbi:PadR family transcriptional regulator [Cupriavidus oxalaticus]|uniref:PadR family transcriptional regulator n=1 Tax=Cupriavidus oxalaticus TaxID=96344 RepID=UPI003F737334
MRLAPHLVRQAMGRGSAGFWGNRDDGFSGDGPGGFDNDSWRRGRKFSADDLQLLLLSLLEEKPSHGYELIKALETRTNGFYKPSPGVVYPALTYLEEVGYATVDTEGNKKRYQLSETGKAHLAANRERVEVMVAKLRHVARKMEWMRRAMSGEPQPEPEQGGWLPELMQARAALKRAMVMRSEADADEQRRIAAILMRAAAEIDASRQG